jgi:ribosomal protein S18 acetylase RimI-like enzyme
MTSMEIRAFRTEDEEATVALWRRCGLVRGSNDPHKDIQRKLKVRPELFLVGVIEGRVVASAMAGYEGHRGWLNYVAVDPSHQRAGLATLLVQEAERRLAQAGCPKINLQVRTSNESAVVFWKRLGYSVDDVVSMGKRLEVDHPNP